MPNGISKYNMFNPMETLYKLNKYTFDMLKYTKETTVVYWET